MTAVNSQLKTVLLLGALSTLLIGIGALVAPGQLYLFGGLALVINLGAYYFSDRIVLRMHRASEVSPAEAPELFAVVAELAARAGRLRDMAIDRPRGLNVRRAALLPNEW
jgi:heat shock protein HtpX